MYYLYVNPFDLKSNLRIGIAIKSTSKIRKAEIKIFLLKLIEFNSTSCRTKLF